MFLAVLFAKNFNFTKTFFAEGEVFDAVLLRIDNAPDSLLQGFQFGRAQISLKLGFLGSLTVVLQNFRYSVQAPWVGDIVNNEIFRHVRVPDIPAALS